MALATAAGPVAAAENADAAQRLAKLIGVLQSDAPPQEKAITCKQLAIYGTKDAVPALAPLLEDEHLASWARTALEAIPDEAAADALRGAMGKVKGRLLVGVINSIGVRRDAKSLDGLVARLKDADPDVASAAAAALGRIGGAQAAKALEPLLASGPPAVRSVAAEGCILCAERFLADGNRDEAVRLYDTVRKADLPKQRILEATRGAILARGAAGVPLLVEQLTSTDKALFSIGLRTARELPGAEATEALATVMAKAASDRQALLLLALADRGDPKALPAVLRAVKEGPAHVRVAAMGALERFGDASCVPVLLGAALESDADVAQAARATLARLPGRDVDAFILSRLPQEAGDARQVLIELAGQRRIEGVLPAMVRAADDADAGVRAAAIDAIGGLGNEKQVPDLVRVLQKTGDAKEQAAIEKALMAICGRAGAACAPPLMPLVSAGEAPRRIIGLRTLACAGGPEALAAVKTAITDKDETVQDEAVRTLATWPSRWPQDDGVAEPLLALAKSAKKVAHQVLGLRGYLQFVQGTSSLNDDARLAKINEVLPLATRPEDKKLVLSALAAVPHPGALKMAESLLKDEAVRGEAEVTVLKIAQAIAGSAQEEARAAAEMLKAKASTPRVREQAAQVLAQMEKFEDYVTAWQMSGPYEGGDKGVFETAFAPESAPAKAKWQALAPGSAKQAWMMDLLAAVGGDS
ncbi:MAG: HEAT repeat domain-containing protein, partial [Planctomycetes bacterium]|nr:HEAT repeat domain-containing protein [Planctomycetota bacterium]